MRIVNVTEENVSSRRGRKPGEHYLKSMDLHEFLWEHNLLSIHKENPWIMDIVLVENPYLRNSLARANFEKNRVELSSKLFDETVDNRKVAFIKAICHFIAFKEFGVARGEDYDDIVKRYINKLNQHKRQHQLPKTTVSVHSV